MAADARGVVEERDESGLHLRAGVLDVRAVEGVGLPKLVGVRLGESEPVLALAVAIGLEQFEAFDQPGKRVRRHLRADQDTLFDAQPVEQGAGRRLAVGFGQDRADRFEQFLGLDLAGLGLVGARNVFECGDAVLFVAPKPGLDGAPGKLPGVALLVSERHGADGLDPRANRIARGHVDCAQHAHFQIGGWIFHAPARWGSGAARAEWIVALSRPGKFRRLLIGRGNSAGLGGVQPSSGRWKRS